MSQERGAMISWPPLIARLLCELLVLEVSVMAMSPLRGTQVHQIGSHERGAPHPGVQLRSFCYLSRAHELHQHRQMFSPLFSGVWGTFLQMHAHFSIFS